jgi:hypothetical protein
VAFFMVAGADLASAQANFIDFLLLLPPINNYGQDTWNRLWKQEDRGGSN